MHSSETDNTFLGINAPRNYLPLCTVALSPSAVRERVTVRKDVTHATPDGAENAMGSLRYLRRAQLFLSQKENEEREGMKEDNPGE